MTLTKRVKVRSDVIKTENWKHTTRGYAVSIVTSHLENYQEKQTKEQRANEINISLDKNNIVLGKKIVSLDKNKYYTCMSEITEKLSLT